MGYKLLNTTYNNNYEYDLQKSNSDILEDYTLLKGSWDALIINLKKISDFVKQLIQFIDNRRGNLNFLVTPKDDTILDLTTMLDYKLIKIDGDKTYINALLNEELNSLCN